MTYRKLALTNVRVKSDFADSRQASPCTECAGRSAKSGNIHRDLHAVDLLKALVGVSYMATSPDWQQSAGRLVDILITGSRPIKWPPANTTPELSALPANLCPLSGCHECEGFNVRFVRANVIRVGS